MFWMTYCPGQIHYPRNVGREKEQVCCGPSCNLQSGLYLTLTSSGLSRAFSALRRSAIPFFLFGQLPCHHFHYPFYFMKQQPHILKGSKSTVGGFAEKNGPFPAGPGTIEEKPPAPPNVDPSPLAGPFSKLISCRSMVNPTKRSFIK